MFNLRHEDFDRFPIDLSRGYDTFRKRNDSPDEHLDGLLDTLVQSEKREGQKTEIDLITWRGMMTKVVFSTKILELFPRLIIAVQIMTIPFENEEGFEMNATCFQVRNLSAD